VALFTIHTSSPEELIKERAYGEI